MATKTKPAAKQKASTKQSSEKKKSTAVKRARLSKKTAPAKAANASADISSSYNQFKTYQGRQYTGMKIGRSHKWYYDKGEWKEKKISPDEWQIHYAVTKRRAGKAPEGSGVPVGTEYNWYILAHQNVRKVNANDYTTELTGIKYKLAHKRANKSAWSASAKAQRRRLIKLFHGMIEQLEEELGGE